MLAVIIVYHRHRTPAPYGFDALLFLLVVSVSTLKSIAEFSSTLPIVSL